MGGECTHSTLDASGFMNGIGWEPPAEWLRRINHGACRGEEKAAITEHS